MASQMRNPYLVMSSASLTASWLSSSVMRYALTAFPAISSLMHLSCIENESGRRLKTIPAILNQSLQHRLDRRFMWNVVRAFLPCCWHNSTLDVDAGLCREMLRAEDCAESTADLVNLILAITTPRETLI